MFVTKKERWPHQLCGSLILITVQIDGNEFLMGTTSDLLQKNTIRDGGSTALLTADTVDTYDTVDTVDPVDTVHTVHTVYTVDMVYTVDTVDTVDMVYTVDITYDE